MSNTTAIPGIVMPDVAHRLHHVHVLESVMPHTFPGWSAPCAAASACSAIVKAALPRPTTRSRLPLDKVLCDAMALAISSTFVPSMTIVSSRFNASGIGRGALGVRARCCGCSWPADQARMNHVSLRYCTPRKLRLPYYSNSCRL